MFREFARRSPRVASGVIYAAGNVLGMLVGLVVSYVVSGRWKAGALAVGVGFGTLALLVAQRKGIVPRAEELNRPISLGADIGSD